MYLRLAFLEQEMTDRERRLTNVESRTALAPALALPSEGSPIIEDPGIHSRERIDCP